MALETTVVPPFSHDKPTATRSNSIISTASSGGASLTRRSRTRTRTLTGGKRPKSLGRPEASHGRGGDDSPSAGKVPPTPKVFSDEPQEIVVPSHPGKSTQRSHPPRRPKTAGSERRPTLVDLDEQSMSPGCIPECDGARGRQAKSEGGSVHGVKTRPRGMSLPRQAFMTNVSSDSSSQPSPMTPGDACPEMSPIRVAGDARPNLRDSVITTTSSSLYPASTCSARTESSLLSSSFHGDGDEHYNGFGPEIVVPGNSDFDADDVSYRLRLLVNNSYFLPPAHAKPSPMSLAPAVPLKKAQSKQANTTFLDFFRLGKSKSKPTTPVSHSPPALDQVGPILRTTSDSTTASGYVSRPLANPLPTISAHPAPNPGAMNRVVVLRERMDDLAIAAKEAEQELKSRSDVRQMQSRETPQDTDLVDDVIDPTDAVDLPPSLDGYSFAVQASTAFVLGIGESVGAAILAEQLPPSSSPATWSVSSEDDSWRKDLLHQAVSHSLKSTPDQSFRSSADQSLASPTSPTSPSTALASSATGSFSSVSFASTHRHRVGRPIVEDLALTQDIGPQRNAGPPARSPEVPLSAVSPSPIQRSPITDVRRSWMPENVPPARAETPSEPLPLAPPPSRKQLVNPLYSLSQPDLSESSLKDSQQTSAGSSQASSQVVRKTVSSPRLSAVREQANAQRTTLSISPPPGSIHQRVSPRSSPAMQVLRDTPSFSSYRSMMSGSRLSDDNLSYATPMDTDGEQSAPRPSVSVSLFSGDQSMSEYSAHSPTASAFHDALFGSCRSPSPYVRRSITVDRSGPSRGVSPLRQTAFDSRSATMSPPPRVSSSLLPTVLPPPPRSPAVKPVYRPSISSEPGRHSFTSARCVAETPVDEELMKSFIPPVPPIPLTDRRGHAGLSLRILADDVPSSLHSAPAPASPTAFFDRIQSHHNAMDDLDTSDESEDDEDENPPPPPPPEVYPEPLTPRTPSSNRLSSVSSRPSIMRLGNHSTPHLTSSSTFGEGVSYTMSDRKKPIGNVPDVPPRASFFSMRKKGMASNDVPVFPFPPPQSRTSRSRSLSRRPATAESSQPRRWQRESLIKFDGMLLQHMQAERDRIKQITSNISASRS